jgi:multiple sugar transport system substrate-binding protein
MKKGIISLLVTLSCVAFIFNPTQSRDVKLNVPASKIRVSGWLSSPSEEAILKKTIDEFEKDNPDIKIIYEPISGNYDEKIKIMLAENNAPDLFYMADLFAQDKIRQDIVIPLDEFIKKDNFDIKDFYHILLEPFKFEDKIYGLPKDFATYALFINVDLFKKSGLDPNKPPETWEELENYAKILTKDTNADGKPDEYGIVFENSFSVLMTFILQAKSYWLNTKNTESNVLDDNFIKAVDFYVGLYKKGYAKDARDIAGISNSGNVFSQGNVGMVITGTWVATFLDENYPNFNYKIHELPRMKKGSQRGTVVTTVAWVISRDSKDRNLAWQFLKYITGKKGMFLWTSTGIAIPSRKSVVNSNPIFSSKNSTRSIFVKSLEYAKFVGPLDYDINAIMQNKLNEITLGNRDSRQAMEETKVLIDAIIKAKSLQYER